MPLREILARYERTRAEERDALEARRAQARALHPGFLQLEERARSISTVMMADIRAGIRAKEAGARAEEALRAVRAEERKLLLSLGLAEDHLTLHARCPRCGDTGYVGAARRTPCACLQKALLESSRASSRVNEEETFARFNPSIYPSETQKRQMLSAVRITKEYADSFPDTRVHNLVFMGEAGLGKSFLLNCIAARVLDLGYPVEKVTAYTMQERILAGIRAGTDGAAAFLNTPLLLIDDLGTEPMMKNITREYLFTILNERRNGHRHTVVATNLAQEKLLERYSERTFSRLISSDDTAVLRLTGEDLRLHGRRETP